MNDKKLDCNCPHCGEKIELPDLIITTVQSCPICKQNILIKVSYEVKE